MPNRRGDFDATSLRERLESAGLESVVASGHLGGEKVMASMAKILFLLSITAAPTPPPAAATPPEPTPVIRIDSGELRGHIVGQAKDVFAYKGIPYAKPPVGPLRWRLPEPPASWEGVRDCFTYGNACPQRTPAMMKMVPQMAINAPYAEDCLYLNVWRPASLAAERLPVLVWIHGGGYTMGAASQLIHEGESLARRGVVFVSINYRLGPFGFLAHPALSKESPQSASGNYGIADQIEALRWVKRNIAAFGGDPNRVMIFGESAGGGSVLCLMVSPLAKGLFSAAAAQSAPEMNLVRLRGNHGKRFSAEQQGVDIITKCGLPPDATAEQMRGLDAELLVKISPALEIDHGVELQLAGIGLPIAPVVDGWMIPDEPNAIFAAGKENPVPMIIGTTRDEMTLFLTRTPTPKDEAEYRKEIEEDFGPLTSLIAAAYPGKDPRGIREAIIHLAGDITFGSQARYAARKHAEHGYPTYRYVFSRGTKQFPLSTLGAHHACELGYLFGRPANPDEGDRKMVDLVQGYWVNFAAKGDPNGAGLPEWPRFASGADVLIELENGVTVRQRYRADQLDAVDQQLRQPKIPSPRGN